MQTNAFIKSNIVNTIKTLIPLLIMIALCEVLSAQTPAMSAGGDVKNAKLSYKIISSPDNSYGYDIINDGRLMIHQPIPPGHGGTKGFKTKDAAARVADMVIIKIKSGQIPPTVSEDEMQKIKAL